MRLGKVETRLLIVAGWLLGAGTATGISLLAVSLLGQGIASVPSQQLTVASVNRALASGTATPSGPPSAEARVPVPARASRVSAASRPQEPATPQATPARQEPEPGGTLLSSPGGSVVAGCGGAGAYLISWSPEQGYQVKSVLRGPAPTARATFQSGHATVTMLVSCRHGAPSAVTGTGGREGRDS